MSRKAKSASKEKRKKEKRARKETERARYKAYAESGKNFKSFRFSKKAQKPVHVSSHPNGKCGNIGCSKCFPMTAQNFKPFMVKGNPVGMPHWMYLAWKQWAFPNPPALAKPV